MKNENPVNVEQARVILGGEKPCDCVRLGRSPDKDCPHCFGRGVVAKPWSRSYMCAVKKAMGIKSRNFFLSDVRKFIRENPEFTSKKTAPADTFKSLLVETLGWLKAIRANASHGSDVGKLINRVEKKLATCHLP